MNPPTDRSVLVTDSLAFGAVPHNKTEAYAIKAWLEVDGIVVDLREVQEYGAYEVSDWKHVVRYPVTDMSVPASMSDFHDLVRTAATCPRVYVHCRGGHGRSGVFVAGFLLFTGVVDSAAEALTMTYTAHQTRVNIKHSAKRMGAPQNAKQKKFVREYEKYLAGIPALPAPITFPRALPTDGPVLFYKPAESFYEFSNFWGDKEHRKKYGRAFKLHIDGKDWPNTEAYFQAQKFRRQSDVDGAEEYMELIRQADTANKVFKLGTQKCAGGYGGKWNVYRGGPNLNEAIKKYRKTVAIRPDWDAVKYDIMKSAVVEKFRQNPDLMKLLQSTGSRPIVEHTTRDRIWADGGDGGTGKLGTNWLGKILMEIRDEVTTIGTCRPTMRPNLC